MKIQYFHRQIQYNTSPLSCQVFLKKTWRRPVDFFSVNYHILHIVKIFYKFSSYQNRGRSRTDRSRFPVDLLT